MKTFYQFILESFLDDVEDEETRKLIQKLIQSGEMLKAYQEFKKSSHAKKNLIWSKKNPKFYSAAWDKLEKKSWKYCTTETEY